MKIIVLFTLSIALLGIFISSVILESENEFRTYLQRSGPFVGADIPRMDGIDGSGIKIAIIDTGVDFNHPDLFGWGPDGKVIDGYNFIHEDQPPLDTNGHGTQVAGVIAADGQIVGIAPKAKILAYKVSENGEGVSSDLIIRAIEKAIEDEADIINISLGVNKTNPKIDRAVNLALEKEIFVVTAAGNDGPGLKTIGSPGRNSGSVTVGATYNNLTSSLVATLEIDEKPYTVIPMVGSSKLENGVTGKIIFGGYGKIEDFEKLDVENAIVMVERGSGVEGELLYFSIKEKNAARAGAKALIVYNDKPGIFLGELTHEFVETGYTPQIPVVSMDREEGLEIIKSLKESSEGIMNLFYNPDFVVHFSSRGPVSPFYIKPEIVAPGAYINTTQNNAGYNFTSGTSFAAPHVSGAAALLLQKNPELHHHEIKSILLTTVKDVSDAYDQKFSIHEAGAGRLDIGNAYNAKLIIIPPNFVVNVSAEKLIAEQKFNLKLLDGKLDNLDIKFEGTEFVNFAHIIEGDSLLVKMSITEEKFGDHEGRIIIHHKDIRYVIPFLLHYTEGSIFVTQENQKLYFDIHHPDEWSFAKISIINSKDASTSTITTTPDKKTSIEIYENSEYWIDAKIRVNGNTSNAYNIIEINSIPKDYVKENIIAVPEKQMIIITTMLIGIAVFGLIKRRQTN